MNSAHNDTTEHFEKPRTHPPAHHQSTYLSQHKIAGRSPNPRPTTDSPIPNTYHPQHDAITTRMPQAKTTPCPYLCSTTTVRPGNAAAEGYRRVPQGTRRASDRRWSPPPRRSATAPQGVSKSGFALEGGWLTALRPCGLPSRVFPRRAGWRRANSLLPCRESPQWAISSDPDGGFPVANIRRTYCLLHASPRGGRR